MNIFRHSAGIASAQRGYSLVEISVALAIIAKEPRPAESILTQYVVGCLTFKLNSISVAVIGYECTVCKT